MRSTFNDVLEAVEQLAPEEQANLVDLVQRRLAYLGRQRIIADVREARAEFQSGKSKPATVDEIMREIES